MKVFLRKTTESDINNIFVWRNSPSARKNSFNSNEINWEEHMSYWTKRLAGNDGRSFIITADGTDVGLIRLDKKEDGYEVNILIAEEHQGRGYGKEAVSEAKKLAKKLGIKKLNARVKPSNTASQKIFDGNGFTGTYIFYECDLSE